MMTITQCRMARIALGWGVRDLAKHAHVGTNTVSRFESGKAVHMSSLTLMRLAFEKAGVRFLDDGGIVPPKKST
jgi:transcriptional regulator with XRE-family HTH domain